MVDRAMRESSVGALAASPRARLRRAIAWLLGACVLSGAGFVGLRASPARVMAFDMSAWPTAGEGDAGVAPSVTSPTASTSIADAPGPVPTAPPTAEGDAGARIPLNRATMADLERLPGIGPKRAEAIVALRTRLGRFRRVEELLRVRGLGKNTLKRLRPLVEID